MPTDTTSLRRAALKRSRAIAAANSDMVAAWQRWLLGDRPPAHAATGSVMAAKLKRVRDDTVRGADAEFKAAKA